MIIRENTLKVEPTSDKYILCHDKVRFSPKDLIFFDLEHYVYKKPKCIGVFGTCIFNEKTKELHVTQYMIENRMESIDILYLAEKYFIKMKQEGKKAIVTFSGNNDFSVINYLFKKYGIDFDFKSEFASIDIQKEYERDKASSIGLKNLEKYFGIVRESEVMSGSNLAKTFHKVMKDKDYISRMPKEKLENILLYNEQDVVNLYHIFMNWKQYISEDNTESPKDISVTDESLNKDSSVTDIKEV